jgi:phage-related protein
MTDVQKELGVQVEEGNMSFGNMVNAISVVQKKMGIAGTSAQEAGKTIQGSFNAMKSSWNNFLTALGNPDADMQKAMNELMESIGTFLENAMPILENILDKIIEYLPILVEKIIQKLPELITKLIPKVIESVVKIGFAIIQNLPQILAAIFQALVTGVGALVSSLAEGFANLFGPIGEALGSFFSGVWETLCNGAQAAWEGIQAIFGGIAEWFGNVFRTAWEAVKAVFETGGKIFSGIVEGIVSTFKTIVNGIITGINSVVAIPFNAINGFLNFLKGIDILGFHPFDWVSEIAVPQIPLLAQGGYASGAAGAVIGEEGPEVVLPLSQNTDNWSGLLANALAEKFNEEDYSAGRGIVIENQNFNIDSRLDAENIGHIMMQSIRRQAR